MGLPKGILPPLPGTLVPEILNRAGTAPCPMEQAAAAVTDPAEALPVLRQALQELQKQ